MSESFYQLAVVFTMVGTIWLAIQNIKLKRDNIRSIIIIDGLLRDGAVLYAFENIHAKRIQDIEQKLGMESIDPEVYKDVQMKIMTALDKRAGA